MRHEVVNHAHLLAALINSLLKKNSDILVTAFDYTMYSRVDACVLSVLAVGDDYLELKIGFEDVRRPHNTGYLRYESMYVLASDYTLKKATNPAGAWRLTTVKI